MAETHGVVEGSHSAGPITSSLEQERISLLSRLSQPLDPNEKSDIESRLAAVEQAINALRAK